MRNEITGKLYIQIGINPVGAQGAPHIDFVESVICKMTGLKSVIHHIIDQVWNRHSAGVTLEVRVLRLPDLVNILFIAHKGLGFMVESV
jgi:hypothetical protein